ncbi:hypothetical protein [Actinoplanes regularis]|nr:hypothetical protein [Actinoplanes regularis]
MQQTTESDSLDGVLAQLPPNSRPGPPTVDQYDALLTGTGR